MPLRLRVVSLLSQPEVLLKMTGLAVCGIRTALVSLRARLVLPSLRVKATRAPLLEVATR